MPTQSVLVSRAIVRDGPRGAPLSRQERPWCSFALPWQLSYAYIFRIAALPLPGIKRKFSRAHGEIHEGYPMVVSVTKAFMNKWTSIRRNFCGSEPKETETGARQEAIRYYRRLRAR